MQFKVAERIEPDFMKKEIFLKNVALLTVTSLLIRTVGMIFRIYMSNKIGAEGIGLYQLIFSVYIFGATFASSGISTAVTKLVADELVCGTKKSVKRILHRAITLTAAIGIIISLIIFFKAGFIAEKFINDLRAVPALKILSFSFVFMGISSCIKGYFMARRKAGTPCIAQIFEQGIRILLVVYMLSNNAEKGIAYACFTVLFSDTVAEVASCLLVYLSYKLDQRKLIITVGNNCGPLKHVTRNILNIAVPITAGRYLSSALHTIENLIVPANIQKYIGSKEQSLSIFGMLKGMALPVVFFPSSFLTSISALLIPEISQNKVLGYNKKIKNDVSKVLSITLTTSILISGVFILTASHLGRVIYKSNEVGFMIKVLAPLVPVMYLETVVSGMLKGLNQQNRSLLYSAIDSLLRIGLIFLLVPKFGLAGFLGMMVFSNILTSYLNLKRLIYVTKVKFQTANWVLKPLLSLILGYIVTSLFLNNIKLPDEAYIISVAIIFLLAYITSLCILKGIKSKDLSVEAIFT